MALAVTRAVCGGKINSRKDKFSIIPDSSKKQNYSRTSKSGMEFESDWTQHRKSLAFTALAIRFATSFMPWSSRIPINEGYHEFL